MAQLTIQQAFDLALEHHQAGKFAAAEPIYRQILAIEPTHAGALHYTGVVAHQNGQHAVAVDLIRKALAIQHHYPEAHENLGSALKANGQLPEAIAEYRVAAAMLPNSAHTINHLGLALLQNKEVDEAIIHFRNAIAMDPGYAEAFSNLSNCLCAKGEFDGALAMAQQSVVLNSNNGRAYGNLGNAFWELGHAEPAIAAYRQAIAIEPQNARAHLNMSMALMSLEKFEEGWPSYEARWHTGDFRLVPHFAKPQWDGTPIQGRTLLIHAEQGLGDAIQFSRYVPMVADWLRTNGGGQLVFECQPELVRLFQPFSHDCQIIARGELLPAFDFHCPLLSLPKVFKTTLQTIPAKLPYLFADPDQTRIWQEKLQTIGEKRFKVALTWAGNAQHHGDRARSIALDQMMPLGDAAGVTFYSLQKGDARKQLDTVPEHFRPIDLSADLNDFADTAAAMSQMDLIITADTSVAHLAGALGRPVWVMLPLVPDWRWLKDRQDSPWYPSMRLFRQATRADWAGVVSRMSESLREQSKSAQPM